MNRYIVGGKHAYATALPFLLAAVTLVEAQHARAEVVSGATGASATSSVSATWTQIPSPTGRALRTYVVQPADAQPRRAIVVVHENRGLTNWETEFATRLAQCGYAVVVPDMLSERGPQRGNSDSFESTAAAREAIHALSAEEVARDLDAAVNYAQQLPARNAQVVVTGFCWGGAQAFRYAGHNHQLAAVIVFYGAGPSEEQLARIQTPVYAFYGETDVKISADVPKLKSRLKALDKHFTAVTFAGAGHSFMRTGTAPDAGPADRQAHDEAWSRLAELLATL